MTEETYLRDEKKQNTGDLEQTASDIREGKGKKEGPQRLRIGQKKTGRTKKENEKSWGGGKKGGAKP